MAQMTLSARIRPSPYQRSVEADGMTNYTIYNKMVLPLSFGDLKAEYDRLVHGVAMWDVAGERQLQVAGPDSDRLVQRLAARDLSRTVEGQGRYVAMCDEAGTLLNDPVLLKLSGGRWWFSLADSDMLLWARGVAVDSGLDVEVTEPDVSPLAVQGPKAIEVVASLFGDWVRDLGYFRFRETDLQGIPLVVCRSGWSKQGGYELFLQDGSRGDELYQLVKEAGTPYGIGPGAPNHVERVESGLLSFGGDTTPGSNPFEAGMGRFVDVDCEPDYIGKGALQRVAAEGPARLFTGLMLHTEAPSEWPLVERQPVFCDGEQVGTMSAVVHSHRLDRTIALAQIQREIVESSTPVEIETPDGPVKADIHELPFV